MLNRFKYLSLIGILAIIMSSSISKSPSLYTENFKINSIEGKPLNLTQFKGKKLLLVNTASKCGYTRQYKALQSLSQKYKDKLVVIGFPCNQFGGQEPGSASEIAEFCQKNYGVTFPLTEKINVKGDSQHPLYKWLTKKQLNGVEDSNVNWNFQKYLISENGELIKIFGSSTAPLSKQLTDLL